ncbi:MAG TPA: hypothetical protein DCE42_09640 [Myxococcales bacterium]|nr:hypothetical protein [Deltaproteobacteria bacterium]HAA55009.1 hypothetical protein [Myxococcales bacterium]
MNNSQLETRLLRLEAEHLRFRRLVFRSVGVVLGCFVLFLTINTLMAQSAPLVYSGYLEEKGIPIDGLRDVKFTLWDNTTGGTTPLCTDEFTNTSFLRGRFKLPLKNCLTTFQQKTSVWAELSIKSPGSSSTTYTPLGRQQVGAVALSKKTLDLGVGSVQCSNQSYYEVPTSVGTHCSKKFTLVKKSVVLATFSGYGRHDGGSGSCQFFITFDTENRNNNTSNGTSWLSGPQGQVESVSSTRMIVLNKGTHEVFLNLKASSGTKCILAAATLNAVYIPTN